VLKFNTRIIKQFSLNTSCFIVCEATCFGPYMTIIRPSYESSLVFYVRCSIVVCNITFWRFCRVETWV